MPGPSRILAHVYRPDGSLYGTAELAVAEDGLTFADVPVCAEPLQGHYREVRRAVELMGRSHEVRTASGFVVRRVRDAHTTLPEVG